VKRVKSWIAKAFAPFIYKIYKDEIERVIQESTIEQMSKVQAMIIEALESGLELNIVINPDMMEGMGMYLSDNEEEEEVKENPFKLVKKDEDNKEES
jgi:hypothetical protein